jgi:hypothetical protein
MDYRCEDGNFLVSASCLDNFKLRFVSLSSSKTGVNPNMKLKKALIRIA